MVERNAVETPHAEILYGSDCYDVAVRIGILKVCFGLITDSEGREIITTRERASVVRRFAESYTVQVSMAKRANRAWKADFIEDVLEPLRRSAGEDPNKWDLILDLDELMANYFAG